MKGNGNAKANGNGNGENLSDRVANYLIQHIRENGLTSGQPLPSEVQVAAELKISRGIVRERLLILKTNGVSPCS